MAMISATAQAAFLVLLAAAVAVQPASGLRRTGYVLSDSGITGSTGSSDAPAEPFDPGLVLFLFSVCLVLVASAHFVDSCLLARSPQDPPVLDDVWEEGDSPSWPQVEATSEDKGGSIDDPFGSLGCADGLEREVLERDLAPEIADVEKKASMEIYDNIWCHLRNHVCLGLTVVLCLFLVLSVCLAAPHKRYGSSCSGYVLVDLADRRHVVAAANLPLVLATVPHEPGDRSCSWEMSLVCIAGRTRKPGSIFNSVHSAYEALTRPKDQPALEQRKACQGVTVESTARRIEHAASRFAAIGGQVSYPSVDVDLVAQGEIVGALDGSEIKDQRIAPGHGRRMVLSQVPNGLVTPASLEGKGDCPAKLAEAEVRERQCRDALGNLTDKPELDMEALTVASNRASSSKAKMEEECNEAIADKTRLEKEKVKIEQERDQARTEKTVIEQDRDKLKREKTTIENERDEATQDLINIRSERDDAKSSQTRVEQERDVALGKVKTLELSKQSGETQRQQLQTEIERLQKDADQCHEHLGTAQDTLERTTENVQELQELSSTCSKSLAGADADTRRLTGELKEAREEIVSCRQTLGGSSWGVKLGSWKLSADLWRDSEITQILVDLPHTNLPVLSPTSPGRSADPSLQHKPSRPKYLPTSKDIVSALKKLRGSSSRVDRQGRQQIVAVSDLGQDFPYDDLVKSFNAKPYKPADLPAGAKAMMYSADLKYAVRSMLPAEYGALEQLAPLKHVDPFMTTLPEYLSLMRSETTCANFAGGTSSPPAGKQVAPKEGDGAGIFELIGAGRENANGRYVAQGAPGRPVYQHETRPEFTAEWRSQAWHIMHAKGGARKLYTSTEDSATLPLTGWKDSTGQGIAPLVVRGELLDKCRVPLWPVSLLSAPMFAFRHKGEAWAITERTSASLGHALEHMSVRLSCKHVEDSIQTFTLKPQAEGADDRGRLMRLAIFNTGLQEWSNFPAVKALLHRDIVFLNTAIPGRPLADYSLEVVVAYVRGKQAPDPRRPGLQNCAVASLRDLGIGGAGSAMVCFRITDVPGEQRGPRAEEEGNSPQDEGSSDWGSQMESLMSCLGSVFSDGCGSFEDLLPQFSGAPAADPCDPRPAHD